MLWLQLIHVSEKKLPSLVSYVDKEGSTNHWHHKGQQLSATCYHQLQNPLKTPTYMYIRCPDILKSIAPWLPVVFVWHPWPDNISQSQNDQRDLLKSTKSLKAIQEQNNSSTNSLMPAGCQCNVKSVIFKLISRVDILNITFEIALRWLPQYFTDD